MYWPCGVPRIYAHNGSHAGIEDGGGDGGETQSTASDSRDSFSTANPERSDSNISPTDDDLTSDQICDFQITRSDSHFVTITTDRLSIWSSQPTALLTSLKRSKSSVTTYGHNVAVSFRPDSKVVVVQTSGGYLFTYTLQSDPQARVFQQRVDENQFRRQSRRFGTDEASGLRDVTLQFRRAIRVDAGINAVLAVDSELVVATSKPAAIQCIKWEHDQAGAQTSAQLLSKMEWIQQKTIVLNITHDRAMSLSVWLTQDGKAYAVQRAKPPRDRRNSDDSSSTVSSSSASRKLFDGYCFHSPSELQDEACIAKINARFSLIAVSTKRGEIWCYAAKDYVGNIPLMHKYRMPGSIAVTGSINCLAWSPDGYCLFAGFEKGWGIWSVFGNEGTSSFSCNTSHARANREQWLLNIKSAAWTSGGNEMLLTCYRDNRIWKMQFSRSAAAGCFSCANLVRALLHTSSELTIYQGHEMPDLTSISNEASLWHHAQYPANYMLNQWPIKLCAISQNGRYVAVAGRRGLAHYSLQSARWKTFGDANTENSFAVRGGMCWFDHILAVATESAGGYDLRLYSRDLDLGRAPLHAEVFSAPIVFIGPSGEDSLLVYTHENILYHYVISTTSRGAHVVQVGQIAFHGVVRAPSRVRSVSWVLPDTQLRSGDPSRDVEFASVLFLIDDKLVLLQPSRTPEEALKYDMRVITHRVEYYILMRDQTSFNFTPSGDESGPQTPSAGASLDATRTRPQHSLRDSLWAYNGSELRMWQDVRDVLQSASGGLSPMGAPLPQLAIPVDFYPLSILLTKGVILGVESELLQRRDVSFAQHRNLIRTHLFIPYILRQQLCDVQDTAAALGLASQYEHLSYFPHVLEILLHNVLDDECDTELSTAKSQLPNVLSFLQTVLPPATYLSTIVQCVRKTELSSWRALFEHLPTPLALFEQALELGDLKTASGYLIVLQGLEEDEEEDSNTAGFQQYVVQLMKLAKEDGDYELCSELARFMIAIDPRGYALREVIKEVGFTNDKDPQSQNAGELGLSSNTIARTATRSSSQSQQPAAVTESAQTAPPQSESDYFSRPPGKI